MSSYINSLQSMLQRDPKYSVRGPVLQSQQFVDRFQQDMVMLEFECMHGAQVRAGYGFFASVTNERNTNKSRARVFFPADLQTLSAAVVSGMADEYNGTYYLAATDHYCKLASRDIYEIVKGGSVWELRKNGSAVVSASDLPSDPWDATWPSGAVEEVETATPVFRTRSQKVTKFNQFISAGTVTRVIVPKGTAPDTGTDIWESEVVPYDEWHDEKTTLTVDSTCSQVTTRWDENLRQFVTSTAELVQSQGTSETTIAGGTVSHIWYQPVKCGWWVKHTEGFSSSIAEFWDSESFYWPPVATQVASPFFQSIVARACVNPDKNPCGERTKKITYPVKYLASIDIKEAYNGPTKVRVQSTFVASVSTGDIVNEVMIPEAIHYDGIIQDFKLAPTLHEGFLNISESVGEHPSLEPAYRVANFPATSPTDWPETITRTFVQPYMGGYIKTTKTYYKPA